MSIRHIVATLPLFALAAPTVAQPPVKQLLLRGTLASAEGGEPLPAASVSINDISAASDARGGFAATVPAAGLFVVTFRCDGYYESRHVFARAELSMDGSGLRLPPITLVPRRAGRRLLVFGGDVMGGRRYETPPSGERRLVHDETREADTRALLAAMAPDLRAADLASVNLEITLSSQKLESAAPKSIVFYANPELAQALKWAGVDYVAQGNNHSYDYLDTGLRDTLAAVDAAALGHSGAGLDVASAVAPWRTAIDGQPWSFLSFVGWKGNVTPNQVAEPGKGGAAFGEDATIVAGVTAETKAGRAVVLQYHGSAEYSREPTQVSERRMRAAIDAGAALVIGHHPHVLQGFELYRGKLIAHSLGNFLFDQTFPETQASMLLQVWMDGDRFVRAEIIPVDERDYRPVPAVAGMRRAVLERLRALSGEYGLRIADNGGHGVITPESVETPVVAPRSITFAAEAGTVAVPIPPALAPAGWPAGALDAAGRSLVFGRALLWRGDFESQWGFGASDRSWAITGGAMVPERDARNGDGALGIVPAAGAREVLIGQKVALRDISWAPMTVTGAIRGTGETLAIEYQYRAEGTKGETGWRSAGSVTTGTGWTPFSVDLPAAETKPDGFRIRFAVRGMGKKLAPFALDDLAIVNWEPQDPADRLPPGFRSYVRLDPGAPSRTVTLDLVDWAQPPARP